MEIKSPVTADERLRVLGRCCDALATTPAKIVGQDLQARGFISQLR